MDKDVRGLIRVKMFSRLSGRGSRMVYRDIEAGRIKGLRFGGKWLVPASELAKISERKVVTNDV